MNFLGQIKTVAFDYDVYPDDRLDSCEFLPGSGEYPVIASGVSLSLFEGLSGASMTIEICVLSSVSGNFKWIV